MLFYCILYYISHIILAYTYDCKYLLPLHRKPFIPLVVSLSYQTCKYVYTIPILFYPISHPFNACAYPSIVCIISISFPLVNKSIIIETAKFKLEPLIFRGVRPFVGFCISRFLRSSICRSPICLV